MAKLLVGLIAVAMLAFAFQRSLSPGPPPPARYADLKVERETPRRPARENSRFHCDGRTRCSQMTSCAEATFFLENCPGAQMDGESDGVPCERQWCGER